MSSEYPVEAYNYMSDTSWKIISPPVNGRLIDQSVFGLGVAYTRNIYLKSLIIIIDC